MLQVWFDISRCAGRKRGWGSPDKPWCWLFCDRDRADRGTDLGDCAIEDGALMPRVREHWNAGSGHVVVEGPWGTFLGMESSV